MFSTLLSTLYIMERDTNSAASRILQLDHKQTCWKKYTFDAYTYKDSLGLV